MTATKGQMSSEESKKLSRQQIKILQTQVRIIQNTTDFTNEQIKYIMTFVNPLLGSKIDPYLETPLDIVVRVLYESERDNEFGDDNCLGHYYPWKGYLNKDGLPIFEKPRISIIIPKAEDDIKFPLYSDTESIKYCDSKGVKLQMRLIKRLQQLTLRSKGYEGYLYHLWLSRTEYLVYIIAHELRHHWQHIVGFKKEDKTPDSYWYKRTTVVSKISICTGRGSKNENIKLKWMQRHMLYLKSGNGENYIV